MLQVLLSSIDSFNMDGLDHIFLNELKENFKIEKKPLSRALASYSYNIYHEMSTKRLSRRCSYIRIFYKKVYYFFIQVLSNI